MKKIKENLGRIKITGKVIYYNEFYSEILKNKRTIVVWLPPSYYKNKEKRFPVLYMHDGQNIMNPATSFAGVDWQVDETVSRLIKDDMLEEIIVVGIYNTADRLKEYSLCKTGIKYMKFVSGELKEFIDKNYKTEINNTAVMGSSMGGLISFLIAWNYPAIINKAACMSSSFYYDSEKVIKMVNKYNGAKKEIKIYVDHGEDGLIEGQKMFCALSAKKYLIGKDIDYFYAPNAGHNEAEWAKRLERPLIFLFGK